MEVVQIGIGIMEQFSEGIVVLPIVHHVPDRPDATDLGVDGLVELALSLLDVAVFEVTVVIEEVGDVRTRLS